MDSYLHLTSQEASASNPNKQLEIKNQAKFLSH